MPRPMPRSPIRPRYLKANYPVEFLAASMTLDIGNTDRLNVFRQEAQRLGVKVAPPDINVSRSGVHLRCRSRRRCSMPWRRSKAWAARRWIMWWRCAKTGGPFKSLSDFARRVDPRQVNKRAFENLVRAGAFDSLNTTAASWWKIPTASWAGAQAAARERESGQISLFGGGGASEELRLTSHSRLAVA